MQGSGRLLTFDFSTGLLGVFPTGQGVSIIYRVDRPQQKYQELAPGNGIGLFCRLLPKA